MKWILLIIGAIIAYIVYKDNSMQATGLGLPLPVSPVATDCTSRHDAQGNWYGLDISGNCTIQSLGGSEGDF